MGFVCLKRRNILSFLKVKFSIKIITVLSIGNISINKVKVGFAI